MYSDFNRPQSAGVWETTHQRDYKNSLQPAVATRRVIPNNMPTANFWYQPESAGVWETTHQRDYKNSRQPAVATRRVSPNNMPTANFWYQPESAGMWETTYRSDYKQPVANSRQPAAVIRAPVRTPIRPAVYIPPRSPVRTRKPISYRRDYIPFARTRARRAAEKVPDVEPTPEILSSVPRNMTATITRPVALPII
jgi:hypothetical protein